MLIIGDVHGKIYSYKKLISNSKFSIQVGDFGFRTEHQWHLENIDSNHKINFGNHDDTSFLNEDYSLGNFFQDENYMTVRGALSIDKKHRTEGLDWWRDEELSYLEMQDAIDVYNEVKPEIMITHDCPMAVKQALFGYHDKTITNTGLQTMFENHQPDYWVFGHYHKSIDLLLYGTTFICLDELQIIEI